LFKAAAIEDRSTMNATFLLNDESHAATFDVMWKAEEYLEYQDTVQWVVTDSMYNALPIESVQV
jgi:phosphoserine aminotransferase